MARYRKKPVEIAAFRYDGDFMDSGGKYYIPNWAVDALNDGTIYLKKEEQPYDVFIKTLEGDHHVSLGDFIIKGIKGELYPCKPDIFEQTYERIGEKKMRKNRGSRVMGKRRKPC